MNSINIVGRLTRDPEARMTQGGIAQSKFGVAVDRDFKNADGKRDADFFNVIAWRGTADFCNNYLTKGRLVEISGRVQTGRYEKDGVTYHTFDVMVSSIRPLDKPNSSGGAAQPVAETQDFTPTDDAEPLPF